jgi:hypothetical protein
MGPTIILNVRRFSLAAGCSVGLGNVFRSVDVVHLGESARMGSWNWVTAAAMFAPYDSETGEGSLVLGHSSAITSRHYLDCSGGLTFGSLTTVAGVRSTWLTHRIDLSAPAQFSQGTRVGNACFVASGVQVGPGVTIPDNTVIAMGSVVVKTLTESGHLYGGVPVRDLGPANNDGYVLRTQGYVVRSSPGSPQDRQQL